MRLQGRHPKWEPATRRRKNQDLRLLLLKRAVALYGDAGQKTVVRRRGWGAGEGYPLLTAPPREDPLPAVASKVSGATRANTFEGGIPPRLHAAVRTTEALKSTGQGPSGSG